MKKFTLYICCLLLLIFKSHGQEIIEKPAQFITRVPFKQLTAGVILMKALVHPFPDSLSFILDTGSGGISLDSTLVDHLGLQPVASEKIIRGIAGIRPLNYLYHRKLIFSGLSIDSLNFHVNNYEVLTAVYGLPIHGIIGYSVLSRYILKINYDSSVIEFWTNGIIKYPKGGHMLRPVISTLPVHYAQVQDEDKYTARYLFDLGAGMNLLLTSDFVRDSTLLKKKRRLYNKEAEGLGGKIDMKLTVIKMFKIGPYKFRKVPIYIFDDEYNITSYPYLGGLIGSDLLRRFNIILNYQKREFHLKPNSHFSNAFDYVYSGVELYYMDGLIIIGDVSKGSYAEASGIKEGDIVVAINRDFSQNLQSYKESLQHSVGKARIIVLRNGEMMEFDFKVKSILSRK